MSSQKKHLVRINADAHRDLKIISAITGRPMGTLIEEMIFDYKINLVGDGDWAEGAHDLVAAKEHAIEHAKGATDRKKEREKYKREIVKEIGELREEGLTFEEIANRFTVDGYQTISGKGSWQTGTVSTLFRKHKEKESELPTIMELIAKNAPWG